ncbi:hypothetical protein DYB30_006757 [Aphanomyces astaci]|uniref:Uncharacterized protein n=1 Tax=Aphanomyces astaci TaxID=112090 RepID=A0A397DS59_APHAT|nr:hypothetical protein DYB30_006757 [Aphanomyces astaci]
MTVKQLHDELAKRDLDKKGAKVMSTCRYVGSPVHRDCRQLYKRDYSNTCSDTPVVPPPAKDDDTQTAAIAEVATIPDSTANPPKAKQPNSSHDSADIASSNTGKAVELSIPCNGRLRLLTDEPVDTANTSTTPTVSSSSPDPSIEHAEFKADSTAIDADKALDGKRHLSPPLHSSPRAAKKPKLDATDSIPESKYVHGHDDSIQPTAAFSLGFPPHPPSASTTLSDRLHSTRSKYDHHSLLCGRVWVSECW